MRSSWRSDRLRLAGRCATGSSNRRIYAVHSRDMYVNRNDCDYTGPVGFPWEWERRLMCHRNGNRGMGMGMGIELNEWE